MEIHRLEKIWIAVSLVFIVGLVASIVYGVAGMGVGTVGDTGQQLDPNALEETRFADPGGHWASDDHYVVTVVARQFLFQPGSQEPVMVPANTTVTLYVTSPDVVHGFDVVGTHLNAMVIPGQVTKLTTEFDEPKSYGIVCHEYCGAGHQSMAGQLVVVPADELPRNESGAAGNTSGANATSESATASADASPAVAPPEVSA
ncbi:cytochrome c oxidase subunit 2 [Halarchaeum rubridurum]|uniref:Cytochrome c oxidase subunit 2 n=1 Tax=Halarchaeum rubridurum TaxID=489911 RepID=A0A830FYS4_9EURY|nr:cytochrome C oxidase subunit II [Halarchaeum rubridurum]MBP1954733.1 cytochrome c oxidase subunit 2 [Halarchaeum rubridurum]GGM63434.1 cytochrome c oxidase subunit II [Halarchaeum rubridurum]